MIIFTIIARIFAGLTVIGFFLGIFLYKKHKIFENIFGYTLGFAIGLGILMCFMYAILGF